MFNYLRAIASSVTSPQMQTPRPFRIPRFWSGVLAYRQLKAGIEKSVSCHVFRHSFFTHLLEQGCDIRTVQELMGHQDVSTTMIYTQLRMKKRLPARLGVYALSSRKTHVFRSCQRRPAPERTPDERHCDHVATRFGVRAAGFEPATPAV